MGKKIAVDISYLENIGVTHSQIKDIVREFDPEHWINSLPQCDEFSYSLRQMVFTPFLKQTHKNSQIEVEYEESSPTISFLSQEDADFIADKAKLLIEMSNFSYAVNKDWQPDWNDKIQNKYGIVLKSGKAQVSENPVFNLYVFGIVVKTQALALEMLEEFKERIEFFFNKPFNSVFKTKAKNETIHVIGNFSQETENEVKNEVDEIPIINLDLSRRAFNAIYGNYENFIPDVPYKIRRTDDLKIKHLRSITEKELSDFRNVGQGTVTEIIEKLSKYGVELSKNRFIKRN